MGQAVTCKYCEDKKIACKGHNVIGIDKKGKCIQSGLFLTWEAAEAYRLSEMGKAGNDKWSVYDRSAEFQDRSKDDHLKDVKLSKQKMAWLNEVKKILKKK